ncbi:MAG: response regulator receiver protein [Bacteroidetes bacterium]|nr:response regulator receiver protein [Bacteroidota bacterium]
MKTNALMIIDDDSDDRTIFTESVGKVDSGIRCLQASNGMDGYERLLQAAELPDYVFVDVNMPNMTGFELLTKIRATEKLKNLKVIIYTTANQRSAIETAKNLGADGFFTKPDEVSALVKYISGLVHSKGVSPFMEVGLLAMLASLCVGI